LDAGSGFGSRNAKRIDKKMKRKEIYGLNNWMFSLEGWREGASPGSPSEKYCYILSQ
jgi:hypothetical protein